MNKEYTHITLFDDLEAYDPEYAEELRIEEMNIDLKTTFGIYEKEYLKETDFSIHCDCDYIDLEANFLDLEEYEKKAWCIKQPAYVLKILEKQLEEQHQLFCELYKKTEQSYLPPLEIHKSTADQENHYSVKLDSFINAGIHNDEDFDFCMTAVKQHLNNHNYKIG